MGECHALCGVHPHEQCSGEPGAMCNGYAVELMQLQSSLLQRTIDYRDDRSHVLTRGDFGDDTPVLRVHVDLGCDYV